jgi:hypothetical protein
MNIRKGIRPLIAKLIDQILEQIDFISMNKNNRGDSWTARQNIQRKIKLIEETPEQKASQH